MKRRYTGAEIAEAILVYDELRRCGAVNKGVLNLDRIAAGYRKDWVKDVDIQWGPLKATVEELDSPNPAAAPQEEGEQQ